MGKETKHYCDECGEEVYSRSCVTVRIFITNSWDDRHIGSHTEFKKEWDLIDWKSKEAYNKLLCENCVGSHIYRDETGIKDHCVALLKRLGIIKNKEVTEKKEE